ncbi:alpha-1,2-fucosyltransferase [Helicobacter sp. 23-1045]
MPQKRYARTLTGEVYISIPLDTLEIAPFSYFDGYWFSTEYLKDSAILAEFTLKSPLSKANQTLKNRILNTQDSAFLHIRRGDYLAIENCANLCVGRYYEGAISFLKKRVKNPHIFIFSNDILWCRAHFLATLSDETKAGVEFEFVANNGEGNAAQEMELMRACKHAITANSTFSWWAGFLMENPQKIVIMPNRYFNDGREFSKGDIAINFKGSVMLDSITGEVL